ncbi:MAG: DUF120 domain-containing protein [Candidatus Asgardarchaeia archaeon]
MEVSPELWFTLYELVKYSGKLRDIEISTYELARLIKTSQQTASRRLIELSKMGLIVREFRKNGEVVSLTPKGCEALFVVFKGLKSLLEGMPKIKIKGELFTGVGEGAYYVSLPRYKEQFKEKLGFEPYPGTLNLRVRDFVDLSNLKYVYRLPGIEVEGFSDGLRTYGGVKCFPVLVNGRVKGAIIRAVRTHYPEDVVEVIAPVCLRDELKLRDGDEVELEIVKDDLF